MWISNTATTAMMVPIAEAVLSELKEEHLDQETIEINEDVELGLTSNPEENKPKLAVENNNAKRKQETRQDEEIGIVTIEPQQEKNE